VCVICGKKILKAFALPSPDSYRGLERVGERIVRSACHPEFISGSHPACHPELVSGFHTQFASSLPLPIAIVDWRGSGRGLSVPLVILNLFQEPTPDADT